MGQDAGIEGTPTVESTPVEAPQPVADVSPPSSGGHPAWQEALQYVPQSFHDKAAEVFKKWDDNANSKYQQVQSQYEPYRTFLDNRVPPDVINASLRLAQMVQSDPRAVYDYLAEQMGLTSDQGQKQQQTEVDMGEFGDEPKPIEDPRIAQLERQQQQLMSNMQLQYEADQQRQGDIWLAQREAEINAKYQNVQLDWEFILNKASVDAQRTGNFDAALDNAAQAYVNILANAQTARSNGNAPAVLPTSGGVASSQPSIKNMSGQDRRKFVQDYLEILDKE